MKHDVSSSTPGACSNIALASNNRYITSQCHRFLFDGPLAAVRHDRPHHGTISAANIPQEVNISSQMQAKIVKVKSDGAGSLDGKREYFAHHEYPCTACNYEVQQSIENPYEPNPNNSFPDHETHTSTRCITLYSCHWPSQEFFYEGSAWERPLSGDELSYDSREGKREAKRSWSWLKKTMYLARSVPPVGYIAHHRPHARHTTSRWGRELCLLTSAISCWSKLYHVVASSARESELRVGRGRREHARVTPSL